MQNIIKESFYKIIKNSLIELTEEKIIKISRYAEMVLEYNKTTNLTGANSKEIFIERHVMDSLSILNFISFKENDKILDMGTGAGLPGVPLSIFCRSDYTLVDSLKKRIFFLEKVKKELNLDNVKLSDLRAEEFGRDNNYRESFDYAVSRALAPLNLLLEYIIPSLKPGGKLYAYKGNSYKEEIKNANFAMTVLSVKHTNTFNYSTDGKTNFVILELLKEKKTEDKYPRRVGIPSKRPL